MKNPSSTPMSDELEDELDSHVRVYKDGKKIVDRTTYGKCGLSHISPLTHDLHEIIVAEQTRTLHCDDCAYGLPSPHQEFVEALFQWVSHHTQEAVLKARKDETRLMPHQYDPDGHMHVMSDEPIPLPTVCNCYKGRRLAELAAAEQKRGGDE